MINVFKIDVSPIVEAAIEFAQGGSRKIKYLICNTRTYKALLIESTLSSEERLILSDEKKIAIVKDLPDFSIAICDNLSDGDIDFV